MADRPGPLAGVRVFDLTLWMVGPWAGMRLGALGADVLHIERPGTPPEQLGHVPPTINGTSAGYLAWNMNKRGLALDLKDPQHLAQALDVAATCDIFLVNMRPQVADRLGLGYQEVSARHPGIVYCDVTGWGHDGPMARSPGSDGVIQGYCGFWSLNGPEGEFYRHYTQMDASTGELTVVGALAALRHRRRTGEGQRIRISMLKASMYLQGLPLGLTLNGERLHPRGAAGQTTAPDDVFRTADRLLLGVSVTTGDQWLALCDVLDEPALAADPRYRDNAARLANSGSLTERLRRAFAANTRPYWLWRLRGTGVPYGYPLTYQDLRTHDQVRRLGLLPSVPTRTWGPLTTGGSPWTFSRHSTSWTAPPLAGEHSGDILGELRTPAPGTRPRHPVTRPPVTRRRGGTRDPATSGPLAGTRVLEIADGVPGPYCGLLLADLGAEVVKVEPPGGDRSRHWRGDALPYRLLNRGKRGATLPLADPRAAELVAQLAAGSDAVVTDTDALSAWPHLSGLLDDPAQVVCRISLFGAQGPMADLPVAELPAQLLSEATASVGRPGTPARVGVDIGSCYAGIYSAQAVLAALLAGEPGSGEVIDVSLVGSLIAMRSTLWVALTDPDEWWGFHLESYDRPPFRGYRCADGRIYFDLRHAAAVDWDALLGELGIADVRDDPRFPDLMVLGAGPGARYADAAAPVWDRAFGHRSVREVTEIITRYGGDVFRLNDYPELLATEQVAAVGNVAAATARVPAHIRPPWEFSAGPPPAGDVPAPAAGTSARDALADCGADPDALARWTEAGLL